MTLLNYEPAYAQRDGTIANGAALTGAFDLQSTKARGFAVVVPGTWTAADIAFQVSEDDSTYYKVYDKTGARVKITGIATSEAAVYVAPAEAWAVGVWRYLKLESINTGTGAAENQGAERALTITLMV